MDSCFSQVFDINIIINKWSIDEFGLYLGQIALQNGSMIDGDIVEQTQTVLGNIKTILEDAGSNMNKVVKCTVFLRNISDFDLMNGVYRHYFNISSNEVDSYPARSAIAVRDLPLGAQVEIEAIALP